MITGPGGIITIYTTDALILPNPVTALGNMTVPGVKGDVSGGQAGKPAKPGKPGVCIINKYPYSLQCVEMTWKWTWKNMNTGTIHVSMYNH